MYGHLPLLSYCWQIASGRFYLVLGLSFTSVKNPYYICTAVADLFIVQPGGFLKAALPKALLTELINEPVRYFSVALFRLPFLFIAA